MTWLTENCNCKIRKITPLFPSAPPGRRGNTCNVGFIDGSVRQFTAKMNPDKTVKSHDAIRRYFMIRWPSHARPDPRYPS